MASIYRKLKQRLTESVERMKNNYNKKTKSMEAEKKAELVMLNGQNIWAKHRCKKLENKMLGSLEVLLVGSNL